ncbi:MAG: hypothetical protein MO846_04865 [Candidatus Devosia symbiotica]|nr:hypothetical protein [Candidatus Devosia symbiotica]
MPDTSGNYVEASTTQVPLTEGTCYDWHLHLQKVKGDVNVTEIYKPCSPLPATWELGADSMTTPSDDLLTATTPLTLSPENSWISSGWCVAIGDTADDYLIEIMSGDTTLETFAFELREP